MNKLFLCMVLLLYSIFPLFAQTGGEDRTVVCVQHVTGGAQEDNLFITNLLIVELQAHDFIITENHNEADYSFFGLLIPEAGGEPGDTYNLLIMLQDNNSGEVLAEQSLLYSSLNREVLSSMFQFLVIRMIAAITPNIDEAVLRRLVSTPPPVETAETEAAKIVVVTEPAEIDDSWRNENWYLGGFFTWAPRAYIGDYQSVFLPNIFIGASAEYHFRGNFSIEAGMGVTADWVSLDPAGTADYRELLLEIPFSFRYVLKPSTHFMLEPYAGFIFNFAFYSTIKPPPLAWMIGFQYGVKAGKGVVYVDPRFSMDITRARLNETMGGTVEFNRIKMYMGVGYKIGLHSLTGK